VVVRRTATWDGMAADIVLKTIGLAAQAERGKKGRGVGVHVGVGEGRGGWGYAAVGSAGRPVAAPRQRAWAVELFREQGRAAGCVRRGVAAADRWGWAATGTGCQR
jgi:hypothetical protein